MPQQTTAQARVVDPVLTQVAQGFENAEFVGESLFPVVNVAKRGGKIVTFGKEDFQLDATDRAPGANTKRVNYGYSGSPYALTQHALEGVVTFEQLQEANNTPGIDNAKVAIAKTQRKIALRLEKDIADLATTAANYAAGNTVALSGTSKWSDFANSDPIADIETAKEQVRSSIGRKPNTILVSAQVMSKLRQHPKIIDRIKYTGRDIPTPELLASLFGVKVLKEAESIYANAAGTFTDVWGNNVIVAFTEIGSVADMGLPSFGYTYRLQGHPVVEVPYMDRNAKSWLYPITDEVSPVIAGSSAGYLLQTVV